MTPRVSYYPKLVRVIVCAFVTSFCVTFGSVPNKLNLLKVETAQAKPMPALESAWVAKQAQRALETLAVASDISAIEQRDVATRWIKSVAVIVAEHLEVDEKKLEQAWLQSSFERQIVLFAALSQLGVPYKTNADEPGEALDCSALIKFAWSTAGLKMPRGSAQQYAFGERVKSSQVKLGDLAWYPGHISMSLGLENLVIQAPRNGRNVEVHQIDESRVNWVRWIDPTA